MEGLRAVGVDFWTRLHETSEGRRATTLLSRSIKSVLAALIYYSGLAGFLLKRLLRSQRASLIIGFHGITDVPPEFFSRGHHTSHVKSLLEFLHRHLHPISLEEIAAATSQGESPPPGSFAVTFDDGLVNNVRLVIPVLSRLNLSATFFVPSALVGSETDLWVTSLRELLRVWRRETIPEEPGLWSELPTRNESERYAAFCRIKQVLKDNQSRRQTAVDQLARVAGGYVRPPEGDRVVDKERLRRMIQPGFSVGAHSRTHPILSALDPEEARGEIEGSRQDLEELLGIPVRDFAYPNGRFSDFDETTCRLIVQAGYRCAVTTEPGTVRRGDDRLALRRCMPRNVPVFLSSFDLITGVWADRRRPGDLTLPVGERLSYLTSREASSAA